METEWDGASVPDPNDSGGGGSRIPSVVGVDQPPKASFRSMGVLMSTGNEEEDIRLMAIYSSIIKGWEIEVMQSQ